MKFVTLFCLSALLGFNGSSTFHSTEFPFSLYSKKSLFYIHRSPNLNTVIYDVNLTTKIDIYLKDSVMIYWIRYGEKGQQRDLNYLERTFAYGVKPETVDQRSYKLQFVASKEKSFVASLDEKGQAYATMKINGRLSRLTKIFVQVAEEGWWPKVAYVEFFGLDVETKIGRAHV